MDNINLGIIGFGKLGKSIAAAAEERGHHVSKTFRSQDTVTLDQLKDLDCIVECSNPQSVLDHLDICARSGIPTVCGTTGWEEHYETITNLFTEKGTPFLYASNFSIGMQITFKLNRILAQLTSKYGYKARIEEIHHTQKLDAPSGTAKTLADGIIAHSDYNKWHLLPSEEKQEDSIPVTAQRVNSVPGTHHVMQMGKADIITLSHQAINRNGFAYGAVAAIEFLSKQSKGIYTMEDVINLANE